MGWKPISNNPAVNPKAPPLPVPATGGTAVGDSKTPSNDTTNNDVTLRELAQPVKFTSRVQPVCLPTHPSTDLANVANIDKERDGKQATFVAAWGQLVENQGRTDNNFAIPTLGAGSDKLEQMAIDSYDRTTCVKQLEGFTFPEAMICGGSPEGGEDFCQGDSGGPLVAKDKDGHHELIGVVSRREGLRAPGVPGI
ncbi:transmembrane protease serine 9-like [Paramacrobiotus metropolitanus]|uniref:transmembrane protease serine 9-like n=1 Tax=Paramacrobiotus metropolitanus TaxID=2943436 RepID=UPI00244575AB|nr:transmembrane protease serine 9-like [Paramacrobiotus metropolitanus]